MIRQIQALDNRLAEIHRLVREYRHRISLAASEFIERLLHPGIQHGVIQHVRPVIAQKVAQPALHLLIAGSVAQRFAHQRLRPIPHKTENRFMDVLRAAHVIQHRVDRKCQVQLGIDQRAVQVED